MDTQKIEPLLMDYALGATTPEVAALIEAFQETNADVRAQVSRWQNVANVARQAMDDGISNPLPVFPRRRLQSAQQRARWLWSAVRTAALAACLLLGYLAGIQGHDRTSPAGAVSDVPIAAVHDFWSTERLRAVAEQDQAQKRGPTASGFRNPSLLLQQFGG